MLDHIPFDRFVVLNGTALVLLLAAVVKFLRYSKSPEKTRAHHPVSTLTMTAFLAAMLPLLVHNIGAIALPTVETLAFFGLGLVLALLAVAVHFKAKWELGSHWSDPIEAADGQAFVSSGTYALTRHPMYSTLILWMLGCSLMYVNPLVAGLLAAVFVPMMYFRAKAEERLLEQHVADRAGYDIYRQRTNILIPRFGGPVAFGLRVAGILAYGFFIGRFAGTNFSPSALAFLVALHLLLGFTILPEKAAFSYKSKTGMMVFVWFLSFVWSPLFYLNGLFLVMYIYGLFFNCPCMFVYEKYHGCPCFDYLKRVCKIR